MSSAPGSRQPDPWELLATLLQAPVTDEERVLVRATNSAVANDGETGAGDEPPDLAPGVPMRSLFPPPGASTPVDPSDVVLAIRLPDAPDDLTPEEAARLDNVLTARVSVGVREHFEAELLCQGQALIAFVDTKAAPAPLSEALTELTAQLSAPVALRRGWLRWQPSLSVLASPTAIPEAALIDGLLNDLPRQPPVTWIPSTGQAPEQLTTFTKAHNALRHRRITMRYKPIQSPERPGTVGTHAVPNWLDDLGEPHPFAGLGPIADVTHLPADVLTHSVQAIGRDLRQWRAQLRVATPFALLDLPAAALTDSELPHRISAVLEDYRLPPHLLVLGIPAAAVPGRGHRLRGFTEQGLELALVGYGPETPVTTLTRHPWALATLTTNTGTDNLAFRLAIRTAGKLGITLVAKDTDHHTAKQFLPDGLYLPTVRAPARADDIAQEQRRAPRGMLLTTVPRQRV